MLELMFSLRERERAWFDNSENLIDHYVFNLYYIELYIKLDSIQGYIFTILNYIFNWTQYKLYIEKY